MAFCDRFREARIRSGYTQESAAEKLGIAKSTLSGYEGGKREPTVATVAQALILFGIDASYLYQDEIAAYGGGDYGMSPAEIDIVKKYRALDEPGKISVDAVLDADFKRCSAAETAESKRASVS